MALVAACADTAGSGRPPTNHAPEAVDAGADEVTLGSPIAVGGGGVDASLPSPDRPSVDVTVVFADAARDAGVDAPRDVTADAPRDVTVDAPRDVTVDRPRDATVDATADGFVDASEDAPPPLVEICGNGLDDDLNGHIDEDCPSTQCPSPPAARTRVWFVGLAPHAALRTALASRGLTVESGSVSASALPSASVLVLTIASAFPDAWNDALHDWVERGGAVMTLVIGSGEVGPYECDGPNALISCFGLTYTCTAPVPWGPITRLIPHPITDGLPDDGTPFVNGRGVAARPGVANDPLAEIDGQVVARATSPGCGRVIVWGDEHVSFASYWPHTQRFWEQSIDWLTGAR